MQINLFGAVLTGAVRVRPVVAKHIERLQNAPAAANKSVPPGAKSPSPRRHRALAGPRHDHVQAKDAACQRRVNSTCRRHCYAEAVDAGAQTALIWMPRLVIPAVPTPAQIGGYLKSPSKSASDQGLCGGDMSPPNGAYETRNIKSGSEKGIDAGHVGDISSGAAETPL
jgi:hypothetical protein